MSQAGSIGVTSKTLPGDVATSYVANVGSATPVAHVLNVLGVGGVTTTAFGNTIDISFSGSGTTWNVVTSANNPVTLVASNGYITKGAGVVDFVLPAAAAIGDEFRIIGYGNLWTIAQNAGQSIRLGSVVTTIGVGGSLSASMVTDCIDMICVTANLEFYIPDSQGNPILA